VEGIVCDVGLEASELSLQPIPGVLGHALVALKQTLNSSNALLRPDIGAFFCFALSFDVAIRFSPLVGEPTSIASVCLLGRFAIDFVE
jgi:hypothetical protein